MLSLPMPAAVSVGAILGLIIGSFQATLILRWLGERSITVGRSACDSCQVQLRWQQLIPLLSWALQRGRCRACGAQINPLHPLVELFAALIGAGALLLRPDIGGFALAVFGWQLLTLAILDGRALWLPNSLNAMLALTGLALGGVMTDVSLAERLIGGAAGFASLATIAFVYRQMRGREGLGGGDPKLFGAIGLWLGWQALPLLLLLAAVTGVLLSLRYIGRSDWRTVELALGTLLAIAAGALGTLMAGGWL